MKFESAKPEMTVYDVSRRKMGNTTVSTVVVWRVRIKSVDMEKRRVVASWNGNAEKSYSEREVKRWRVSEPVLIATPIGRRRLATRSELKAIREQPRPQQK